MQVEPAPTDDEAAAIVAALAAYLADRRARTAPAAERRWALAGRLAGQGLRFARVRGVRPTWGTAARLVACDRDSR